MVIPTGSLVEDVNGGDEVEAHIDARYVGAAEAWAVEAARTRDASVCKIEGLVLA